jgi:hypothetical protein
LRGCAERRSLTRSRELAERPRSRPRLAAAER